MANFDTPTHPELMPGGGGYTSQAAGPGASISAALVRHAGPGQSLEEGCSHGWLY